MVLAAVKDSDSCEALQFANERFREAKEDVLKVVKANGLGLCYASDEMNKNREVVLAAVQQHHDAIFCAKSSLQDDPAIKEIAFAD